MMVPDCHRRLTVAHQDLAQLLVSEPPRRDKSVSLSLRTPSGRLRSGDDGDSHCGGAPNMFLTSSSSQAPFLVLE